MKLSPEKIAIINALTLIMWLIARETGVEFVARGIHVPEAYLKLALDILLIIIISFSLFYVIKKQRTSRLRYASEYISVFKASPFPLWIYDRETFRFMDVNKAAEDHYGYTRKEFLSMTIFDIRRPEVHDQVRTSANQVAESYKSSGYWEHIKKDGQVIMVNVTSRKIRFRDRDSVLVIAQDVTIQEMQERKLNELYIAEQENKKLLESHIQQLKETLEEKERLAEVIDRINNLVIITDSSARITWVNEAFIRHTGYTLEEVKGRTPYFLHGPKTDASIQADIINSLNNREFKNFEILNYTKGGEEYWVDMTFSPVYDQNNNVMRYVSIQTIITERKAADEKIREQNRVLKNIAWTNSHALRKPVASIISLVQISSEMDLPADLREIHNLIGVCAAELDLITRKIAEESTE